MWDFVGPARTEEKLEKAMETLSVIKEEAKDLSISSERIFNTEFVDAVELDFMTSVSICVAKSATERKESRGAHVRLDYPEKDDENWLKNIVLKKDDQDVLG